MDKLGRVKLENEMGNLQAKLCEYTAKSLEQIPPNGNAQEMKLVVESITKLMSFVEKAKPKDKEKDGKKQRKTPFSPDPTTALDAFATLDKIRTAREQDAG